MSVIESRESRVESREPSIEDRDTAVPGFWLIRFSVLGSRFVRRDWPALLIMALAALVASWPVVAHPRTAIIGPLGDNVQYVYMTGWVGQSLLLGQSPLVDPRLNFPGTLPLASTDAPFLSMLLVAPVTWLGGPVVSYNLIMFLSSLLSGYVAYLWVRQVSGSRLGGIVAGLAFLLSPFRIAHSYGHLQLVSTQGLPLFFWALDTTVRQARPRLRTLLALVVATALVGCGSQYYLLMALVTGIVYTLLVYCWAMTKDRGRGKGETKDERRKTKDGYRIRLSSVLRLLMPIGAVTIGALVSALPYLSVWRTGDFKPYTLAETRKWSANPTDFVLPSPLHPLWGGWVAHWFPQPAWIEHTLYLGAVALVLAAVGIAWRRNPHAAYVWPWMVTALVGVLLALGTDLHWNNQPLQVDQPFPLPATLLLHLPFANLMRVWTRFGIVPILFVSLLAGLGAARLQKAEGRRQKAEGRRQHVGQTLSGCQKAEGRRQKAAYGKPSVVAFCLLPSTFWLPVLLLALLVLDLLPGSIQASTLQPQPIDRWLANQPGDFAVAFLPQVDDVTNYRAMYGSLFHGKHLPAYNHPTHLTPEYRRFRETADRFPTTAGALHWLGLRYVLLDRAAFDGIHSPSWSVVQAALARTPSLRVLDEIDGYVVVAVH